MLYEFVISIFVTFSAILRLSRDYVIISGGGNRGTRRKPPPNPKALATSRLRTTGCPGTISIQILGKTGDKFPSPNSLNIKGFGMEFLNLSVPCKQKLMWSSEPICYNQQQECLQIVATDMSISIFFANICISSAI